MWDADNDDDALFERRMDNVVREIGDRGKVLLPEAVTPFREPSAAPTPTKISSPAPAPAPALVQLQIRLQLQLWLLRKLPIIGDPKELSTIGAMYYVRPLSSSKLLMAFPKSKLPPTNFEIIFPKI